MKASINWIQELIPGLWGTPEEIAQRLTNAGLEVEGIELLGEGLEGVITAEVQSLSPHPDADRLRIAQVFDGETVHTVVCGAPNVEAGQRVVFAPVGVTLPNGLQLTRRKIRGVESSGMLCSREELGLEERSEGIWVLAPDIVPGQPLVWALSMSDVVLELGITPNRGDALSHLGLARELAALSQLPPPQIEAQLDEEGAPAETLASVQVEDPRCPVYYGRVVTGVRVQPSPEWLQDRLRAVGLRPISNVVDVTNYVLMELGQPLHAFDLQKLEGRGVRVRSAQAGESLALLNGKTVELDAGDLVIADAAKPLALAGVMGGASSEVTETTTEILLEAAIFDPTTVRKTARRLAVHSDSSHRFERGVDRAVTALAIDRAAELIVALGGGQVHPGRLGVESEMPELPVLPIRTQRASMLIGQPFREEDIDQSLTSLGLVREEQRPDSVDLCYADALFYRVPSWRTDLNLEVDLIEEVGRLRGYDALVAAMPPVSKEVWSRGLAPSKADRLRDLLVGQGFYECISLAFAKPGDFALLGQDPKLGVRLQNPLGEDSQFMRPSLLLPLLRAAKLNQDQLPQETNLRLFEIGHRFQWGEPAGELPVETEELCVLMRGRRFAKGWAEPGDALDAYDLKGLLETLCEGLSLPAAELSPVERPWLHPQSASAIRVNGCDLGELGELHPDLAENLDLSAIPVFVLTLNLDLLFKQPAQLAQFKPLSKQPPIERDLSFFAPLALEAKTVIACAREAASETVEAIEIFDVYRGKGVPEGQRSLALSITLRRPDRTLTDPEAEAEIEAIGQALRDKLGVTMRIAS